MLEKSHLPASRWFRLLPIVFITYSLAYLDRANFGFGLTGGLQKDLSISPNQSYLLNALFFAGYFLFQIPGTYAAARNARRIIFWSLLLWGGFAAATGIVSNVPWLMLTRLLLGAIESAVFPSMLVLLSRWFLRTERSRANSFMIFGNPITLIWMSIASAYLIHSLGWRWMFILEGIPAMAWAFCWLFLVEDRPEKAAWMSQQESAALQTALEAEQRAIPQVNNFFAACRLPIVWMLCIVYALWSLAVYGFVLWLPSILHTAGVSIISVGWLSAITYFVAVIGMLLASWSSDRTGNRHLAVWPFLLLGAIAFFGSSLCDPHQVVLAFVLLCLAALSMYAPYGPFFALITEFLPANVAGGAIALINSFGALGAFIGTFFAGKLSGPSGNFHNAYLFMALALLLAAVLYRFIILSFTISATTFSRKF